MPKSKGRHEVNRLVPAMIMKYGPGFHRDGNCLYLKVDPSGARRWIVRTTVQGARRDIGLGAPPSVTLKGAREEAVKLRAVARAGEDPLAEKRRQQHVPTFEKAARDWYEENKASWSNPTHQHQVIQTLETYAFPMIGARKVNQITPSDLHDVLLPIWTKKPETADRVRQRVGRVLDWATTKGFFDGPNPASSVANGLPARNRRVQSHAALPYTKVPEFIHALQRGGSEPAVKLGFEFLILTASRTTEVREAKWSEIDLSSKLWTVPAERMKARREHQVPLSDRVIDILKSIKQGVVGDYVFSIDGRHSLSENTFLKARSNLGFDCTPHGFRSSFRDWAAEQTSYPREVAERALAHTIPNKAEAAYNRSNLLEKRRLMMADWAMYCSGAGSVDDADPPAIPAKSL